VQDWTHFNAKTGQLNHSRRGSHIEQPVIERRGIKKRMDFHFPNLLEREKFVIHSLISNAEYNSGTGKEFGAISN
jgi:hypothetical protein